MKKNPTPAEIRYQEWSDRNYEKDAHERRLEERRQAAESLRWLRRSVYRGRKSDTIFWAKVLTNHLKCMASYAVRDMRR